MDDQNKPTKRMHSSQCKCTVKCNECRVAGLVAKKNHKCLSGNNMGTMDGWMGRGCGDEGGRDTRSECVTQERLRKYANVHCQGRAFVTLGLTTSETGFCLTPVSSSSTSTSHMRASTDAAAVGPSSKSGTFSRCRIFIDGGWWTISV